MHVILILNENKYSFEVDPQDKVKTLQLKMTDKAGVLPFQLTFYHVGKLYTFGFFWERSKLRNASKGVSDVFQPLLYYKWRKTQPYYCVFKWH